ncbi:MAG: leucine-rich repeat domain-containing protein [Clostridia bacterium]|nr:leucine-rich repeat domain-containing protein [Clostridia bacterium]
MNKRKALLIILICVLAASLVALFGCKGEKGEQGEQGVQGTQGEQGDKGDKGDNFWTDNPQGLAFYPQDDGTFAVGAGQAILLSEITVPETYIGKSVTTVIDNGFSQCKNLRKISLPQSIKEVGESAFSGCTNLAEVAGESFKNLFSIDHKYVAGVKGVTLGKDAFLNTDVSNFSFHDVDDNTSNVRCEVSNNHTAATAISVTTALNTQTDIIFNNTADLNVTDGDVYINFGSFGLFDVVKFRLMDGDEVIDEVDYTDGVAVTAKEYNFAPLNGSYPVLVFSLKLKEITAEGTIPTFVYMERTAQYDWDNLPYGVQCMPFTTREAATETIDFHGLRTPTAEYIKQLYSLNSNSKFNLYVVDNYVEIILQMLVANGIPDNQWQAVLLSDGGGTAKIISKTFASSSDTAGYTAATNKYNALKVNWEELKAYVRENGYDNDQVLDLVAYPKNEDNWAQMLENYAYVVTKEESNISWWVNRLKADENIVGVNGTFAAEVIAAANSMYTNNLLAALDDDGAQKFKNLYNFNGDAFSVAEEQGKEAVIILGNKWNSENGTLYNYIKATIDIYGTDKYVYYYKGHPGYPTSQYEGRQEYFDALEEDGYTIYELDNAIAAEIILFFNPDVYMAGYSSSTFDSVQDSSQDKALVLFGKKSAFNNLAYQKYFDVFVSVLSDTSALNGITLNPAHSYFLIEYNNTAQFENQVENYSKHEIAVYDSTDKVQKYYKFDGSVYVEVNVDGEAV